MSKFNIVLRAGVILNAVNLLFKHLHVYERLNLSESVQGFISGVVVGLLLVGLVLLALRPERLEALRAWKQSLIGG